MRALELPTANVWGGRFATRTLLTAIPYPAVTLGGLGLHSVMVGAGLVPQWSAYLVVALGALVVAGLERLLPARESWKPTARDLRTDAPYLFLVQGALPLLLGLSVSLWAAEGAQRLGFPRLWPHGAPLAVQVLLMLLASDFLRYWLHVACHRTDLLWRLHSLHHRPEKLYWLNVGRFHPLEKAFQYLLDALPFALLGVGEEVLALYFVFYALNGFFQHSNLDVRLGFLNYLVSGPELHRWHHSRDPVESSSNYGNNLILWDIVFRTRFLPDRREVSDVGVEEPERGPDTARVLLRLRSWILRQTTWRSFRAAARRPRETQMKTLRRILRENRESRFGAEHRFPEIASLEEFRARVPIRDYEALRPYVEEQAESGARALTSESPCMYAKTSGTTDLPKLIPILPATLAGLRRRQALATMVLHRARPEAFRGKILAIGSPSVEGRLPTGVPVGSASGYLYETMPALARAKYVIPPEAFGIEDYELKYLLILRLALSERNITLMASANASTFLKLADLLRESRRDLLADVERERFSRLCELPGSVRAAVVPRLRCGPARKEELRAVLGRSGVALKDAWPHVRALVSWTGGSAGFALRRLGRELAESTLVTELGYLASELAGTIPVDAETGLQAPTIEDHFFEFVEKGRYERGERTLLTLDELEEGFEYYVIVTTPSGLYRYFMNDVLRVTGRFENTPTLAFVQKGRGATNITGEKLYESQVLQAMARVEADLGFESGFFVLLAEPDRSLYRLLLEAAPAAPEPELVARTLDRRLSEGNLEYRAKRESGRLLGPAATLLRSGAGEAYKKTCLRRGQREAQFKALVLQYAGELRFPWQEWSLSPELR
jgi:sterol desaturase/sphingolipid hydroxylase (fatty acid hydroxylase superfamily)